MPSRHRPQFALERQLVGDPVDAVTGANVDRNLDLRLAGPLPLLWVRHYDSSRHDHRYSLGWGHAHGFDRWLSFDVDGIRYAGPLGQIIGFPPLVRDGEEFAVAGLVLRRTGPELYQIRERDQPTLEFEPRAGQLAAPLKRLRCGRLSIEFLYDGSDALAGIVDSSGRSIIVDRDENGSILRLRLRSSNGERDRAILAYAYDPRGNLIRGTDGYGNSFTFTYDERRRLVSRTDRRGYSFRFEYDRSGRCVRSAGEDGLHEVRLRYHASGLTTVTKADGGEWQYIHERRRLSKIIDPYGGIREIILKPTGQIAREVDPSGNVREYVYDETAALAGTKDVFGRLRPARLEGRSEPFDRPYTPRTPIEWDLGGGLAFSAYRLPGASSDALRQLPPEVAKRVRRASHEAEDAPRVAPLLKPTGPPKIPGTVRRDLFGLVAQVTDPAGSTRRWRYDANGNVISETDADGAVWRFEYVSWNLLDRRIDPVDAVTTYQYTRSERLSRLEDPGGTTTGLAYDLKDRLVALSRAESAIETRRYDAADSLIEKADDRGTALIRVERGPEGLPVKAQYHSGEEWTFAYDDQGRLADAIGASSVEHREYDLLGHVMCDLRDGLGVRHKFSPTRLSRTEVLGRFVTSYRRSEAGLRTVIDPSGKEHTLQFLGDGLFLRTQSNGERELCQYDWRGRSLAKIVFGANRPAWSRQYRYSPAGDLISVDDTSAGPATYSYDAAHRLARVESAGGEHAFGYDPAGNLLYGKGLSGVVVRHNQLTAANGSTYQYDGRGQVARRQDPSGVTEFRYNSADLLVGVQGPSGDWEASYDSFGRRISKKGNNGVTRFYWDRERLAAEIGPDCRLRVYVYYDADARSPFLFVEYESAGADPASGQRYFVFTNQVGCPVRVKDESGATVWRAAIDPYGAAAIHPDSVIELNLRYPGHYFDPETGLHSNRWRYYSPELGRYIQPDPIGIDGGANVYAYAARPLIEVDLDGLACPKPMVLKPDDEEAFRERQAEAVRLAAALREAMMDADTGRVRVDAEGNETPITAHDNTTLAVLVVQRQGEYDIVVASSAGLRDLPENVQAVLGDTPMVAPPPRAPGTVPETGDTGLHAEQRGVRAMDNASNVDGVASVTPTRPCCPGCAQSIRDRGDPNLDSVSPIPGLSKER